MMAVVDMTPEQEAGTACALCGRPLGDVESVPVVLPASGTEVRVCASECRS